MVEDSCKIIIIGNGPSRELYKEENNKNNIIIGCNYPNENIKKIDYSVFADCSAAKLMRYRESKYNLLGNFQLIFGERCANGLKTIKARPGSVNTLLDFFIENNYLDSIVSYPEKYRNEEEQEWVSSGHLAYIAFAIKYPNLKFEMYGFDSLFTGDHLASYSNKTVRKYDDPYIIIKDRNYNNISTTTNKWLTCWKTVFEEYSINNIVTFHSYKDDNIFLLDSLNINNIKKELHLK